MNIFKKYEKLKSENESLNRKCKQLKMQNAELVKENNRIREESKIECERAQKLILSCESFKSIWQESINAASNARQKYEDEYKKIIKIRKEIR